LDDKSIIGGIRFVALFGTGIIARLRGAARAPEAAAPEPGGGQEDVAAKAPEAEADQVGVRDDVEAYWTEHNVTNHQAFKDAKDSLEYLHWRNEQYYGYAELMRTAGFDEKAVLDFGCGPGHDLVGFAVDSRAARLIGVDVSRSSLAEARSRLALHCATAELHQLDVHDAPLPLDDGSIDVVHSSGVLHHMEDPTRALSEFRRVLRRGGELRVMVYNRQSLWFHLYVPYVLQIEEGKSQGLGLDDAFRASTDGPDCPISRAYRREEFQALVEGFGFALVAYGAAVAAWEMVQLPKRHSAMLHLGVPRECRDFLRDLRFDDRGLPMHDGYYAGIDGCYRFRAA
jgi:SAM-dependent methyltransferase